MKQIKFSITEELHQAVKERARKMSRHEGERVSESRVLREALRAFLGVDEKERAA